MSCHRFTQNGLSGWLCLANIYEYKGHTFEFHPYTGPVPLRKDWEPSQRARKGFWDVATEFAKLTKDEQETYRVYG